MNLDDILLVGALLGAILGGSLAATSLGVPVVGIPAGGVLAAVTLAILSDARKNSKERRFIWSHALLIAGLNTAVAMLPLPLWLLAGTGIALAALSLQRKERNTWLAGCYGLAATITLLFAHWLFATR